MDYIKMTQIDDAACKLSVEGIAGDYIFETIKTTGYYYESAILERWEKYICDSKIIFDIGANLGNHTLWFSKHTKYQKIVCFEPYPINYERLSNNIRNNRLENIIAVNKGVGCKPGYTEIKEVTEENLGATSLNQEIKESGDIEIIDLDSYVREQNIQNVDLVKIDTEGYEESVLQGMTNILTAYSPCVWVEISEKSCMNVIDTMKTFGYQLIDVQGFNLLFVHGADNEVSIYTILEQMLNNLGRATNYYQLYKKVKKQNALIIEKQNKTEDNCNVLKEWHENDLKKIESLNQNVSTYKEWHENDLKKIESLNQNVSTYKEWHGNNLKKIQSMQDRLDKNKAELDKLGGLRNTAEEKLTDFVLAEEQQESVLKKAKALIQKQQVELQSLRQMKEDYMALLEKIDSKWYGQLAMKVYRYTKKNKK